MKNTNELVFHYDEKDMKVMACTLPDEVLRYKTAGYFTEEKAAILRWMKKPVGEMLKKALALEYELVDERIKQFPYTAAEALAKLQEQIPDFTEAELQKADQNGLAEWMYINGEKHYIHNIVRNLMRTELGNFTRGGHPDKDQKEREAVQAVMADMKRNGQAVWRFKIHAEVGPSEEKAGSNRKLLAHLPVPAVRFQTDWVTIDQVSEQDAVIDPEKSDWRAVSQTCLDDSAKTKAKHPFSVEYSYQVTAKYIDLWSTDALLPEKELYSEAEMDPKTELGEQLPHICFTPYLKELAAEITQGVDTQLEMARRIYDYITKNVKYSFMKDYRYMSDIADSCARNLRGDCGVQAILFITLCRICGIPAGWQSGLYTNPYYIGAHDWARFYIEGYGWLFADPSLGGSAYARGDELGRQFYFGNLDPFRMCANHRFMQPYAVAKKYLPQDPCDNQTGELENETYGYIGEDLISDKQLLLAEPVNM